MASTSDRGLILEWISSLVQTSNQVKGSGPLLRINRKKFKSLGAYQYSAEVRHGKMSASGTALSFEQQNAFFGAVCEAVERLALLDPKAGNNSNGIALHTRPSEARNRAARELIERHLFLAHYWGGVPFYGPKKGLDASPSFEHAREVLRSYSAKLHLREMRKVNNLHSYVVLIQDARKVARFGLALGCATKLTAAEAVESALCEALNVFFIVKKNHRKMSIQRYLSLARPTPHDHASLAWNPDYNKATKRFFFKVTPQHKNRRVRLDVSRFDYQELAIGKEGSFPFHAFKAKHPQLLDMIFHQPSVDEAAVILQKLNRFWKMKPAVKSLPTTPHPFP